MPKTTSIGDILEIPTKKGYAYVQFSHFHADPPKFGAIIRVLPGFYDKRPGDFVPLVNKKELYYTLFPVQAAVSRKIFSVAGHADLPPHARAFPLFRAGAFIPSTGKVEQWWLWNGAKSWKIDQLSDEQLDLPIKSGWNDILLIKRIEQGWTPRLDEAFMKAARARDAVEKQPSVREIRHFLLFKNSSLAEQAKLFVEAENLHYEIIDNGLGFSLIVTQGLPLTEEYTDNLVIRLSQIAQQTSGVYDSWETAL